MNVPQKKLQLPYVAYFFCELHVSVPVYYYLIAILQGRAKCFSWQGSGRNEKDSERDSSGEQISISFNFFSLYVSRQVQICMYMYMLAYCKVVLAPYIQSWPIFKMVDTLQWAWLSMPYASVGNMCAWTYVWGVYEHARIPYVHWNQLSILVLKWHLPRHW